AGHEEGRDLPGTASLQVLLVVLFNGIQTADTGAHCDADTRAVLRRDLETRILQRIGRGGKTVMHERVHLAELLRRQVFLRVESLHRATEADRKCADVETGDRSDTALTGENVRPCRLDRAANGRNDAQTSHDDTSLRQARTSLS